MNMAAAGLSTPMLREVRLYGALGRQFGRVFRLAVSTPAEAMRALCAVLPGFERAVRGRDDRLAYHVFVGRGERRRDIGDQQLGEPLGALEPIRVVPQIAGAKRGGALQTIVGVVLVVVGAVASAYGYGAIGSPMIKMGAAMILGGVIQMLSPQAQRGKADASNLPSYVFDGPTNNTQQGGPVPVRYGRGIWGSVVVSLGITTEALVVATTTPIAPNTGSLPAYEPVDPVAPPQYGGNGS